MKIIPLSEGSFTVDGSKQFVPFTAASDLLADRAKGSLLVEIQPFVIITQRDVILLDAGLGLVNEKGEFQLYTNLAAAGIGPQQITKVLMSHLHKDHCGGLVNPFTHSVSFENAMYYVQYKEWQYAYEKGAPSYNTHVLDVLSATDKCVFLHEGKGKIDDYITYEITAAHALFHQVFWIKENKEVLFFGADDAPQLQQMKHRFAAKYDYDGKKAMQLRTDWWQQGQKDNWTFLFYHDIQTPLYTHPH